MIKIVCYVVITYEISRSCKSPTQEVPAPKQRTLTPPKVDAVQVGNAGPDGGPAWTPGTAGLRIEICKANHPAQQMYWMEGKGKKCAPGQDIPSSSECWHGYQIIKKKETLVSKYPAKRNLYAGNWYHVPKKCSMHVPWESYKRPKRTLSHLGRGHCHRSLKTHLTQCKMTNMGTGTGCSGRSGPTTTTLVIGV